MKDKRNSGPGQGAASERQEAAAALAITALSFLAGERERLERFLALTGLGPASLRAAARDPNFLVGVLEHVASDETLLLAFANESGIDPLDVGRAREALAGPPDENGGA
jgi:Protein of unknown function (DUF3572)